MTRRLARYAAATALAGLGLTACAGTGVGVAARLGDTRIPREEVAERVQAGDEVSRVPADALQRLWVGQLLKRKLYEEGARRQGVMPSPAELDKLVSELIDDQGGIQQVEAANAAQGVAPRYLRQVLEAAVLYELVADALVKDIVTTDRQLQAEFERRRAQFDIAHVAHIKVADKRTADAVAAQARGGADFAALAKEHSTDARTAPNGGDLGVIGNGPGQPLEPRVVVAVFKARPGSIVGPLPVPDGFEIIRVIERATATFEQAKPELRRGLLSDERRKRVNEYFRTLLDDLGLSVNPRYGRWDDRAFAVVAGGDSLSTTSPSPGGDAGAPGAPGGAPGAPPGMPPAGGQ